MVRINLAEIPAEGRHYDYSNVTGELNEALQEIVGNRPYTVEFFIMPLGNLYQLTGRLKTKMPELCSLCGWDLECPIDRKLNEILMREPKADRKSQSVHGNGAIDFLADGPSVTELSSDIFLPGEFLHEQIVLAEPAYPSCGKSDCEHLEEVKIQRAILEREFQEAESEFGHPGFAALKNLSTRN